MQADADAGDEPASNYGYSVGRWEDDVLVVRTTRVSAPFFDDLGTPFSEGAVIVERFEPSDDQRSLSYEAVVTDPRIFERPATMRDSFVWIPGEQIKPFNCSLPED